MIFYIYPAEGSQKQQVTSYMLLFFRDFYLLFGCVSLLLLSVTGAVQAETETGWIEEIRFVGNDRTKPQIMLQEIVIKVGDPADPDNIEKSRQAIMDLGLFKSVNARLEPGEVGQILEFAVNEKYYVIPLPRLDRSADGEISYGARLTVDNLAGLNQRLRLTYEAMEGSSSTDRTVHSVDMSYSYPRVVGTQYGLGVALVRTAYPVTTLDDQGNLVAEHDRMFNSAAMGLSRWLSREGPSQGWNAGGSLFWRYLLYDQQLGAPLLFESEKAVGVSLGIGYTRVHDHLFSREGMEYGYIHELGLVELGSDTPYARNSVYYRHYFPLGLPQEHKNFNMQIRFGGTGGTVPIADDPFVLGGSRDLRGFDKGSIGGRSFFVINMELLAPLWGHNAARGVVFADYGNAYPDNRVLDFGDLESAVGFGLRYKVKSFVDLQLRVDVTYAFGLDRTKAYIGTKNTF